MHLPELISIINLSHINVAQAQEAASQAAAQPSVVAIFGLDWKLFLAQLVNFGIVLFVLWKWVFKPVAKGLGDRTAKIEASLKEAEKITADKQTFESWKDGEIGKVRQEASVIIGQAKTEAEGVKSKVLQETKDEQQRLLEQAKAQLENEKTKAVSDIKGEIADIVVAATEKIIREKLTAPKDQELVKETLKNVKV